MMKSLLIPLQENKFKPLLLHKNAMIFYIIVVIIFNSIIPSLGFGVVKGDITSEELLIAHNNEREKNGLSPLILNSNLSRSATNKAHAMLESNCWSHYCPDGKEPWDYFIAAGYNYQHAGENLAEGFSSIDSVIQAWMNSKTHRDIILNMNFKEVGFGFAYGNYQGKNHNTVMVVHFGEEFLPLPLANTKSNSKDDQNKNGINPQNFVSIDNIENGDYVNNRHLEIRGKVEPTKGFIDVFLNNSKIGRVDALGKNYSYRSDSELTDGNYNVSVNLVDTNDLLIAKSNSVDFFIDGNDPFLNQPSVKIISLNNNRIEISFLTSQDVVKINTDIPYESIDKNLNKWSFMFNLIKDKKSIEFELLDSVNNSSKFSIKIDKLLELANTSSSESLLLQNSFFINDFLLRIKSNGIKNLIPLAFSVYLLILFSIEFIVLSRTNMLSVRRGSHLNIAITLILVIVFSFGSLTGSILNNGLVSS